MLKKTLESPLDCKEIQPVHHKGDQSWVFIGRTDAEAETPVLWPPDVKNWLTGKDPDAGKDWRQEKGTTEDEMAGWHHQPSGHGSGQAPGDGEGQGSQAAAVHGVAKSQTSLSGGQQQMWPGSGHDKGAWTGIWGYRRGSNGFCRREQLVRWWAMALSVQCRERLTLRQY